MSSNKNTKLTKQTATSQNEPADNFKVPNEEFAEPVAQSKRQLRQEERQKQKQKKKALKSAKKKKQQKEAAEQETGDLSLKQIFKQMFASTKKKKPEPLVQKRVKRIKTDYQTGLTNDQVEERISKGQINITPNTNNKTVGSIIFENVFTFFNILCFMVAAALIIVNILYDQKWNNLLFMVTIIINIVIGIAQEIKAKRTIEKLSLLTAPVVKVIRDGNEDVVDELVGVLQKLMK